MDDLNPNRIQDGFVDGVKINPDMKNPAHKPHADMMTRGQFGGQTGVHKTRVGAQGEILSEELQLGPDRIEL